jgi:hypothetical protein
MDFSTLEKFEKIYPTAIKKYKLFNPDSDGVDVIGKVNSVIEHLNKVNKLSNEVITNWNKVMQWVLEEGLTDGVKTKIDELISVGDFNEIINNVLDGMNTEVTTKLDVFETSLADKATKDEVFLKETGVNINDFDEATRQTFLEAQGIDVNYVLGEKNVTPINTTFFDITVGTNKYNKDSVTIGHYFEYNTGNKNPNAGFAYSEHEEIKANTLYTLNLSSVQTCFYDSNFSYISGHLSSISNRSFTTPVNAKYYISSVNKDFVNQFMLVEGSVIGSYEPYTVTSMIKKDFLPPSSNSLGNLIIVDKSDNGHFTTITDACNYASNGDTIYVMPGVYIESVSTIGKKLNIVGVDKVNCILKTLDGNYDNAPLEIAKGTVSNMTIYSERPEGLTPPVKTSYGVHIDWLDSTGETLTFNNCILKSDFNAGAGIGLRRDFVLLFKSCDFITTEPTNTNGACFFHDSNNETAYGKGYIVFDNCVMKSNSPIAIMPASSGVVINDNSVYMTFYNTIIWSDINKKTSGSVGVGRPVTGTGWRTYNNFYLTEDSYGNNQSLFNVI